MTFKEFIKLTWEKIVMTLLLTIIFVPFISADSGVRCIRAPCDVDITITLLLSIIGGQYIFGVLYLNLILGVIISYLISCAIFYFTKKNKKHKK